MKIPISVVAVIFLVSASAQAQNLVSSQSWTLGSGSIGIFGMNGIASENIREMGTGPHGDQVILWKASPDGNAQADGGWDSQSFSIDNTKMYRFAVWIKKTNSTNGTTYFGCNANDILTLSGTVNTNPYFWAGDLPALGKWYLLVGYVHASSDPSTSNYGGIYDGETGTKVASVDDYKFSATASTAVHRTYLYYDGNTADRQYFYGPEVYQVESSQPLSEFSGATIFDGDALFGKKVGIGTASPAYALDVQGATNDWKARFQGPDGYITIGPINSSYAHIYTDRPYFIFNKNIWSYDGGFSSYNTANLLLQTSGTTRLTILNSNGNVGIGTSSPSELLTVNGTIYGKEVKVDLSVPGPDYVFKKEYDLPSLAELNGFIERNNHLPEVPSAEKMQKEGIELSAMNMLLLKKVEELTLYVIHLEKENQRQDSLIQKLQKQ